MVKGVQINDVNEEPHLSNICKISVILPILYPDMDRKKFRHIFYTLTYLPIQKIWTNMGKVCTFNMAFRQKHMSNIGWGLGVTCQM